MSAGKGDAPRPVNGDKYRSEYERIFGKKPLFAPWEGPYTFDGPEPKKEHLREFMQTYTEGDE